jgi:rhomboid family GlyGly-CTERM serine protease
MGYRNKLYEQTGLTFISLFTLLLILTLTPIPLDWLALYPRTTLPQLLTQPWRLLSGHFVHASPLHLLVNLVNLLLLRWAFSQWLATKHLVLLITLSAIFISFGLCVIGKLSFYVGFSGVFYSLLTYLLLHYWHKAPWLYSTALCLIIAKILSEQIWGASTALTDLIGINVAVDAHALGCSAGIIFWLTSLLWSRQKMMSA